MRAIDVIKTVRGRLSDQAVHNAAKIADDLMKIAQLFSVNLAVSLPRVDFINHVQRFAKALEDGLEILAQTLTSIGADPRWEGKLEDLAKIAGQITQIVGVLDIAKMFSEIQLKRPPQSQIRSIAEDLIQDLKDVTPILREGLREVMVLWGEALAVFAGVDDDITAEGLTMDDIVAAVLPEPGLDLPSAIDFAGQLSSVFGALRDMATAMGDLVGMASGTDAKLPTGLALINVIRKLKALVLNALPEIDLMRIAFDGANDLIVDAIGSVTALFDNLSHLGLILGHIAKMEFSPMDLADAIGGIRGTLNILHEEIAHGAESVTPRTTVGGETQREPVNLNLTLNGTISVETYFDGERYVTKVEAADLFNAALAEIAAGIP